MLKHFALAALFCAASSGLIQPVFADNGVPVKLDRVQFYVHPPEAQILDLSPTVRDCRQPAQETKYVISVPPMPAAQSQTVVLQPGSGSPAPEIVLDPSHPPPTGFTTNIPARNSIPSNLPAGNSTNLLAGHMMPPAPPAGQQRSAPHSIPQKPALSRPAAAEQYAPLAPSTGTSWGGQTSAEVYGKMKPPKMGSMLQR